MAKKSWIQIDGKLIPKEEFHGNNVRGPMVQGDIEPFVSPITKEVIRGRGHLRQHMKQHGVTHADDYSPGWYENRQKEIARSREQASKADRIEILKQLTEK